MFIPYAGRVVGNLVADKKIPAGARVLELGAQTYSVDASTIAAIAAELREKGNEKLSQTFLEEMKDAQPATRPRQVGVPHVRKFFKALGFVSYTAIDIGDYDGNIVMDLNTVIANTYGYLETYDLVTNIGVSEHLINQAAFFENAHRATKVGGYTLHILPSLGYLNHGFFNYEPRFFEDLASANGYVLEQFAFVDRASVLIDLVAPSLNSIYLSDWLHLLGVGDAENAFVLAVFKKVTDVKFSFPLQGKYYSDVVSSDVADMYDSAVRQSLRRSPPKGLFEIPKESLSLFTSTRVRVKRKVLRVLRACSQVTLKYF